MFRGNNRVRSLLAAVVAAAAIVLVAAGCGSSSKSTSTPASASSATASASSGGANASAGAAAAAKLVAAAEKVPTNVAITAPLKSKPAAGKTIVFLQCSTAVCGGFLQGLKPALAALDWKLKAVPFVQTPEGIQTAVSQAVADKPAGIFYSGIEAALVKKQLAQAESLNIPIVNADAPDNPGSAVKAVISDIAQTQAGSRLPADWIAANGGGDTLTVDIPDYPILVDGTEAFNAELQSKCSSCKITPLNEQITSVGTTLPAAIVTALQANPKIKNVALAFGDMSLGVYQAIKAAGLTGINIVQFGASSPGEILAVQDGQLQASLAWSLPYVSWRAMDTMARFFEGQSVTADTTAPLPQMLITKTNVAAQVPKPATSFDFAEPANYESSFMKLWQLN